MGKSIVIIGGGIIGLGAAWELSRDPSNKVVVLEEKDRLGGMSTYDNIGEYIWDRYYHVILSRDKETITLLGELGLSEDIFWTTTKSGFFGNGKLVSLSSPVDFLTFPFLNIFQKARLVFGILFTSRINNGSKLEKQYVKAWMIKVFGRRVYEKIWDPLLRSKLGNGKEETSAAFIWATIRRLYGARSESTDKQEKMGHVKGGYQRILECFETELISRGVVIKKQEKAKFIDISEKIVLTETETFCYNKLLLTTPSPEVIRLLGSFLPKTDYLKFLEGQKYLGVICLRLLLKKSLSQYYVINLLDESLPFTGVIESTNVIGCDQVGGNHLIYLPHYTAETDKFLGTNIQNIEKEFILSLKKIFPDFSETDIIASELDYERFVQPLYVLNYGNMIPECKSPIENVFLANTSMIKNATLNNNAALELGRIAAKEIMK